MTRAKDKESRQNSRGFTRGQETWLGRQAELRLLQGDPEKRPFPRGIQVQVSLNFNPPGPYQFWEARINIISYYNIPIDLEQSLGILILASVLHYLGLPTWSVEGRFTHFLERLGDLMRSMPSVQNEVKVPQ